jgi:multidrug efflux pump subunit AcrA (membrane-fusion protein)
MRFIWAPLAKVQEGLGGKARTIVLLVTLGLIGLAAAMVFVPYPLKMDAKGQLLPEERRWVYSPVEGKVINIPESVQPAANVSEKQPLLLMHDLQLERQIYTLNADIAAAEREAQTKAKQINEATTTAEKLRYSMELAQANSTKIAKNAELRALRERINAGDTIGDFYLVAPMDGTILNWGFRENLIGREVKPSEPLIRIGDKSKRWEIELKIPQKHIGQVLQAYRTGDPDEELDVDILLASAPTKTFKGKLPRRRIAGEASPNKDDPNESDPVVLAAVRIEGDDIPPANRIPANLLVTGTEVHSKIRCGKRAMGYSLFYGLWEFFYEKVVFFF